VPELKQRITELQVSVPSSYVAMHQPAPVAAFEDDCWKSPSTVALGPDCDTTTKKSTDLQGKSAAGSASMPHGSTRQPVGGPAADNSQDLLAPTVSRARRRRLSEHGCECCWLGLSNSTTNSPFDNTADLHSRLPLIEEGGSCLVDDGAHSHMPPLAGNSTRFISPFAGLALKIEQQQPEQPPQERSFSADKQNSLQEGCAASGLGLAPDAQLIDSDGLPVPVFAVVSVKQCKPAA